MILKLKSFFYFYVMFYLRVSRLFDDELKEKNSDEGSNATVKNILKNKKRNLITKKRFFPKKKNTDNA